MSLVNFNTTLTWADFPNRLAEPAPADPVRDSATIGVTWTLDIDHFVPKGKGVGIDQYTVTITIAPANCAVLESILKQGGAVAAALLQHEQGHYNIIALGAREFHRRVASLTAVTELELKQKLDTLDEQIRARANQKDILYDTRTEHSLNASLQTIWNNAIAAQRGNPNGTVDGLPG